MRLLPPRRCRASIADRRFLPVTGRILYCARLHGHDGPHANPLTEEAWVVRTLAVPVTYRYPYEDLVDDGKVTAAPPGEPQYRPGRPTAKEAAEWR